MKKLRYSLLAVGLCLASIPVFAQTLEHLHLVCASRQTINQGLGISVSHRLVLRSYGWRYIWDSVSKEWIRTADPDTGSLDYSLVSPSGSIFDYYYGGSLERSTDGGQNYIKSQAPVGYFTINPSGELFVLGNNAVHRSTDDGQTWDSIPVPPGLPVNGYFFDKDGNLFYYNNSATTLSRSVLYSLAPGGMALDSVCSVPPNVTNLTTAPTSGILFFATGRDQDSTVHLFNEKKRNWEAIAAPHRGTDFITATCSDSSFNIYAGTAGGSILVSSDTGHSWKLLDTGTRWIDWLAFQAPSTLWYATDSHVVQRSTLTGSEIAVDSPFETLNTWSVAAKGDTVYATVEDDSGFFRSLDNGTTWQQLFPDSSLMLGAGEGSSVKFSPDGATYLVAADDADLFRSFGGSNWTKLDPLTNDRYLVVDSEGTAWYSNGTYTTDDGSTWSTGGPPVSLWNVGVNYRGHLCWANDSLFHYSTDEGKTWNKTRILDSAARGYAFIHSAAGRIWLSYDSVLELSTNAGTTWIRAMNGLSHSPIHDITTDPSGNTFCIQGKFWPGLQWPDSCSLYVWEGLASTWKKLMTLPEEPNLGSPEDVSLYVWSLCANSKYLFLGTNVGVFRIAIADFNLGVSPSVGQSKDQTALAYPNPASGDFTVRFYLDKPGSAKITIYDMLGNVACEIPGISCRSGWNSIPIRGSLLPGTYTFQVTAGGMRSRGRVAVVSQ